MTNREDESAQSSTRELRQVVLDAAPAGDDGKRRLACKRAFELAEEYGVELLDIARECNLAKIKITACQLGCFK